MKPTFKRFSEEVPFPIQGLRKLRSLRPMLAPLRSCGEHPNRQLYFDDFVLWLLLSYFNPVLSSMRAMQRASDSPTFRSRTGLPRFSLGSFSESAQAFDPEALHEVYRELVRTTMPAVGAAALSGLPAGLRVLAADATLWKFLPRMARWFYTGPLTRRRKGEGKGHFLYDVLRGVPEDVTLTAGNVDERRVLPRQLTPGALYVLDRGYLSVKLYGEISRIGSSFVARAREDGQWKVLGERPLSDADRSRGVEHDYMVNWQGQVLRLVVAKRATPAPANLHPKRSRGKHRAAVQGEGVEQVWYLFTDRLDLSASEIVLLYAYRWTIEVFFRWLKCTLKCRHLFFESAEGFACQVYAALIATLLIMHSTGCKPNNALWEALVLYMQGWIAEEYVRRVVERCVAAQKTTS